VIKTEQEAKASERAAGSGFVARGSGGLSVAVRRANDPNECQTSTFNWVCPMQSANFCPESGTLGDENVQIPGTAILDPTRSDSKRSRRQRVSAVLACLPSFNRCLFGLCPAAHCQETSQPVFCGLILALIDQSGCEGGGALARQIMVPQRRKSFYIA
jgi:hypothetical protein